MIALQCLCHIYFQQRYVQKHTCILHRINLHFHSSLNVHRIKFGLTKDVGFGFPIFLQNSSAFYLTTGISNPEYTRLGGVSILLLQMCCVFGAIWSPAEPGLHQCFHIWLYFNSIFYRVRWSHGFSYHREIDGLFVSLLDESIQLVADYLDGPITHKLFLLHGVVIMYCIVFVWIPLI